MNSDFLRLSRRVTELEKGGSEDTGSFLRNDSRYLNSSGEVELGSNIAHSLRGGSNSTSSSSFPTSYGQYWHFAGSSRPRDLTLWTQNGGENLYFQTYDYPDGNPQGWNQIWHSGNDGEGSGLDADTVDGRHSTAFAYSQYTSSDLNTVTQSGCYRISTNANRAPGTEWGQVLVIHGGSDTIAQMAFDYDGIGIYWRGGNPSNVGGSGTWQSWRKIWHESNDGAGSGLDADTVDGYHASIGSASNTVAIRNGSGFLQSRIFQDVDSWDVGNVQPYYIHCGNTSSSDRYHRRITFVNLANRINGYGSAKNSHTHSYLPLSGGTMTGTISFPVNGGTKIDMNNSDIIDVNRMMINDEGEGIEFRCGYGTQYLRQDANDKLNLEMVFYNASYNVQFGDAYDSYSECSIFPSSDGKGNCGTPQRTWSQCVRLSGTTGSSRGRKELIRLYDVESAYETVKETQIYSFRYKTEHEEAEIQKMEQLGRELSKINWFNLGVIADQAPLEILNTYTSDDTHVNIDNSIFLTMAALQHAQERIEALEQRVEELENGVA